MTIQKFDSTRHGDLIAEMPFSYLSTAVYLDFRAYVLTLNGEDLIVTQDSVYRHDFPSLFLPKKPLNRQFMSASMISQEDLTAIKTAGIEVATENPTETEFIYSTHDFLNPTKAYKQKINQFETSYKYQINHQYDRLKLTEFFNHWENQKDHTEDCFSRESRDFFFFCLENLEKYDIRQVYVEVDGILTGFVWGVLHSPGKWVSLHIKSNYEYRGLSRFLNFQIAKLFSDTELVSLGTGCNDPGLIKNKKELGPVEERNYHYVLTRGLRQAVPKPEEN